MLVCVWFVCSSRSNRKFQIVICRFFWLFSSLFFFLRLNEWITNLKFLLITSHTEIPQWYFVDKPFAKVWWKNFPVLWPASNYVISSDKHKFFSRCSVSFLNFHFENTLYQLFKRCLFVWWIYILLSLVQSVFQWWQSSLGF